MIREIRIVLVIIVLGSINLFSQEVLGSFENDLKKSGYISYIKGIIPIVNKVNGNVALFITDANNIYAYKLDSNFKLIQKLSSKDKKREYKIIIGYSISDNGDYSIYLSNKTKRKFLKTTFSFNNQKTYYEEITLDKDEEFIQSVSTNNQLYLITSKKEANYLNIYINGEGGIIKKKVDFSHFKLIDEEGNVDCIGNLLLYEREKVDDFYEEHSILKSNKGIIKIDESVPNSIEVVSEKKKMYLRENEIVFSLDLSNKITQVITIKLNDFSSKIKVFKKTMENAKKSNSFLVHDKVFISSVTKEKLVLQILDFKTKNILKEYTILKDNPINFKNTPIIQKGGLYKKQRKYEKTKKFLRKLTTDKFGISVRKLKDNYHVVLGGYSIAMDAATALSMVGVNLGSYSLYFNPTYFAFKSIYDTKSVKVESLLDLDFNHVKGDIKDDAFDKIESFSIRSRTGDTLFKYEDYFIKGEFSHDLKTYTLKKFTD